MRLTVFFLLAGCGRIEFWVHEGAPPPFTGGDDTATTGEDTADSADPVDTSVDSGGADSGTPDSGDTADSADSGDTATAPPAAWSPGPVSIIVSVPYTEGEGDLLPQLLHLADVNGDGHLDLGYDSLSIEPWSGAPTPTDLRTATVLAGDGRGSFGLFARHLATTTSWGYPNGSVGDLNEDGYADYVVGTTAGLTVLDGGVTGFLARTVTAGTIVDLRVVDWDGDGHLDVVTLDHSNLYSVYRGDGLGGLTLSAAMPVDLLGAAYTMGQPWCFADVTGDGLVDLVTDANLGSYTPMVLVNDGLGGFLSSVITPNVIDVPSYSAYYPMAAESDSDGTPEIHFSYVYNATTGLTESRVWDPDTNAHSAAAAVPESVYRGTLLGPEQLFLADLDLDGRPDGIRFLAESDGTTEWTSLFTSLAVSGGFSPWVEAPLSASMFLPFGLEVTATFAVGDVNEDRCMDIVVNAGKDIYLVEGDCD
jgi:hypothetical protein